jgi:hypothetical protein
MPPTPSRRTVLSAIGSSLILPTAGCLGDAETGSAPTEPTPTDASDRATTETTTTRTTVPPTVVSDTDAKERALAAEEAYLTEQLRSASCLSNWGTYPTTASKRATVADRTADGVRVEVVHPYSYSTDRSEADGASRAVYVVTADDAERVSGDTVSPC